MGYTNRFVREGVLSEAFYSEICMNCDRIERISATLVNPPKFTCPCELDYTSHRCTNNEKWVELLADLENAFTKAFGKW